jgi:hypothetical protein
MTNIAMGNEPFIDGLPNLKMVIFQFAMLNNQMVRFYCETRRLPGEGNNDDS